MPPHNPLPPSVLLTWFHLCALARREGRAQFIDTHKLAALTGKSQATLNRHITLLKQHDMLDGHLSPPKLNHEQHQGENPFAQQQDRCKYPPPIEYTPYFPRRILGYISYTDENLQNEATDEKKFKDIESILNPVI